MNQKHKMIKEIVKLATAEIIKAVEKDTNRRLSQKAAETIANHITSSVLAIHLTHIFENMDEDSSITIGLN